MHIVLVSGSHREQSQSLRITQYLAGRLTALDQSTTTDVIELRGNPIPLWDEGMWQKDGNSATQHVWAPYSERLQKADGFVIVSPEWNGMVPSGLMNFLLYCSSKEVGHKPAMITGVSASMGGTYPISELRMVGGKNNKINFIPDHLIVRYADKMFHGETATDKDDQYMRDRADFSLLVLIEYAKALATVRASGATTSDPRFAFGM